MPRTADLLKFFVRDNETRCRICSWLWGRKEGCENPECPNSVPEDYVS